MNPNGFQLIDPKGGTFFIANQELKHLQVDIAGFSEINLDTTQPTVNRKLYSAVSSNTNHCRLQSGSSPHTLPSEYKPGGTITLLRNSATSRYHTKGADKYGRWTYITLGNDTHQKICFITAYQPCKGQPKGDGSTTVITQQYSLFLSEKRPDPVQVRKHFLTDLTIFIKQRRSQGEKIVLRGDFNETLGLHNADGLTALCRKFNLRDAIHFPVHGSRLVTFANPALLIYSSNPKKAHYEHK